MSSSSESDVEYEVEAIIGKRVKKGITYYKVRWLGFDESADTWEIDSNLGGCEELIRDFEKNGPKSPFVVNQIIEFKYDPEDKEMVYSCLNKKQDVKQIPSHLLRIKNQQALIDFLQQQVKIEEHPPAKASGKKKE